MVIILQAKLFAMSFFLKGMKFSKNKKIFRKSLVTWFADNMRDLPWRRTYEPYHVWISEIMLQQTQMERGVVYFNRWVAQFPDVSSVAGASEQVILKAWEGLGYYSRARNVKKAAGQIMKEYSGRIPDDYDQLLSLPGIGPYTASAIMSIAFNKPYPVVDANVERLFARIGDVNQPVKTKNVRMEIQERVAELISDTLPRDFNQALMELGALICTPKQPKCGICPVRTFCQALQNNTVDERPVRTGRQEKIDISIACTVIVREGKIFIQQRQKDDVWGGLWEFPGGRLKKDESPLDAAVRELFEETEFEAQHVEHFITVTHYYTRYRVTLHAHLGRINGRYIPSLHAATQYRWVTLDQLDEYPFPSGHRQVIAQIKKQPELLRNIF